MEIDDPALQLHERMHMPVLPQIHFRPELTMQNPQAGPLHRHCAGSYSMESFGKRLVEVVVQLRFQFDIPKGHEAKPGTDSAKIRICLR